MGETVGRSPSRARDRDGPSRTLTQKDPTMHVPSPADHDARPQPFQPISAPHPEMLWAAVERGCPVTTWRKVFPGTPERASGARRLTRLFLDDTALADDAELIVGELAANATLHTRSGLPGGAYVLELTRTARTARITVYDQGGTTTPVFPGPPTGLADLHEHGYGLRTVALLAESTGVRGNPAAGHAIWAEVTVSTRGSRPERRNL
jgi:anti-sigma regulatory factor (Ser/Thr protein kinase)